jgi:hypothetical protein
MNDDSALNNFPNKQIKPYDGMSVTAGVWSEAHDEHRKSRQAHDLFFHGAGIISGLEVLANDPPDQYIFISPGVAVDPTGSLIVLTEQVAYDFGSSVEGPLYILLAHGEREVGGVQQDIRYQQNEFIVAARPTLPKRPAIELARINLAHRGNSVQNAADPQHPGIDELDLRYRPQTGPEAPRLVKMALCGLGKEVPAGVVAGWDALGQECRRSTRSRLIVDPVAGLPADLQLHDMLYLAGMGDFKLEKNAAADLTAFLGQGKAVFAESFDAPAEGAFRAIFRELGVALNPLPENTSVLKAPYVFNAPPAGNQGSQVLLGKCVVFSTARYSLAWSGNLGGGPASRADIRSATEWGVNLIEYCLKGA